MKRSRFLIYLFGGQAVILALGAWLHEINAQGYCDRMAALTPERSAQVFHFTNELTHLQYGDFIELDDHHILMVSSDYVHPSTDRGVLWVFHHPGDYNAEWEIGSGALSTLAIYRSRDSNWCAAARTWIRQTN